MQPVGELPVLARWCWIAGRVIVKDDDRRRTKNGGFTIDFAGMGERAVQATVGDYFEAHQPIAAIEREHTEFLQGLRSETRHQVAAGILRHAEPQPRRLRCGGGAPSELEGCENPRHARVLQPGHACKPSGALAKEAVETSRLPQELIGQLERGGVSGARAQEHGEELVDTKRLGAALDEFLARSVFRPQSV